MALYSEHTGKPAAKRARNGVIIIILILFALATIFPIYFMIMSSFGDPIEAGAANYSLFPTKFTLDSYKFFLITANIRTAGC